MTVGIPSGRCLPPGLGMNTRLTASALNGSRERSTLATNSVLAFGVSTTSPSTPAVRRPALRSVTRRTLTRAFDRDRSINACNRRTRARSPALDAVKIRCRNRRTSRSTRRHSIWRQSSVWSSGPLTATCVVASSLSSGSGITSSFSSQAHLTASAPFSGRVTRTRIRPVIRRPPAEGLASGRRFPAAFRPPAFASRSSFARRGVGPSSRSADRTRPRARPDPDGVSAFRTHELRPGWAPSIPRGRRCSSRPGRLRPSPAASPRPVPAPSRASHRPGLQ